MPKRARCTGCGTGTHHKKSYIVTEVIGVASGKSLRQVRHYCEDCYKALSSANNKIEELKSRLTLTITISNNYYKQLTKLKHQLHTQRKEIFEKWCWALTFWKDEPVKLINNFSKYLEHLKQKTNQGGKMI